MEDDVRSSMPSARRRLRLYFHSRLSWVGFSQSERRLSNQRRCPEGEGTHGGLRRKSSSSEKSVQRRKTIRKHRRNLDRRSPPCRRRRDGDLDAVVVDVPLDELAEAGGEVGGGLVAEVPVGEAYVGVGVGDVPISGHPHDVLLGLHPEQALQDGHQARYRHRRGVAEVVHPELRRPALLPTAGHAGALLGGVEGPQAALYDVVDEGEVPRHLPLAVGGLEDGDLLPLQDVLGEEEVGHVGPPPGPVHGEEAEPGEGEPVDMVVDRGGAVGAVGLGEGVGLVEPVDGGGRSPDDGRLRVGTLGGGLQQRHEAGDVGLDVGLRVAHGVAHAGLRGEVQDVREGDDVEELGEEGSIVDVALHHEDTALGEQHLAAPLQRGVVVGVEVIEPQHAVAALLQGQRAVGAHEARGAGDQHRHPPRPVRRRGLPHLALPRGAPHGGAAPGVEGRGQEAPMGGVGDAGRGVGGGQRGIVDGEEEDEDEGGEEGAAEDELRRRRYVEDREAVAAAVESAIGKGGGRQGTDESSFPFSLSSQRMQEGGRRWI
ncbi:unnamed protein product [Spirodela intermedia]|uniref:Uncharacterized protein n=1 Tax=Spirodela intermedia TaxID=51605 RepID=A0A7I8KEJ8_SPIIN|nr:unnamed protein product [Spirodela intermedia]